MDKITDGGNMKTDKTQKPSFVEHTTEHAECMKHLTHVCKFCGYSYGASVPKDAR